jgi:DNA primase
MAKISPVSIKYVIHAKFEAEGALEKPDVIGAIFGQTEGLLGADLEMRELQKEGKIGRIDVELSHDDAKTNGVIKIPTSLDKAETTIIGAAIETIDRIGPTNSKIEIERIEDVRSNKRNFIIERAKALLEHIEGTTPESRELQEAVKTSFRTSKIQEFGDEKLSSGDISGDEVIIVEGRADVVNLLKNGVKNVISMNGTILPESIKKLSQEKKTVLFVDGDRGGQLIIKNVTENAKIDFIAVAPDGKEVEELSGKEILQALRKKMASDEYLRSRRSYGNNYERRESYEKPERREARELTEDDKAKLKEIFKSIEGTKEALIVDSRLDIARRTDLGRLRGNLRYIKDPFVVLVDGKATLPVIKAVEEVSCPYLMASNFASADTNVKLISL